MPDRNISEGTTPPNISSAPSVGEGLGAGLFLLTDEEKSLMQDTISSAGKIVVTAHKSPDGDAVGSTLAWKRYLESLGKEVNVVLPDAAPDFLHWLPGYDTIITYDKHKDRAGQLINDAQLIFCLDYNELSRTEDMQTALEAAKAKRIVIDHHVGPTIETVLTVSHPEASSTSELVFKLISQIRGVGAIDHDTAVCIYCGMMTDTGGFTFNSCNPDLYLIISELLRKKINKDIIYNRVFHNYSSWALKLRSYLLYKKLNVIESLHASYFAVTRKEMKEYHFIKGDLEGVVNIPLIMKGHKLSISLREDRDKPNLVFVSLRSSCGFHCRQMAVDFFNGGGHEDAAGGKLFCSIEEAEKTAMRAIIAYKDQLK